MQRKATDMTKINVRYIKQVTKYRYYSGVLYEVQ
jgi:hypothetical protein